MCADIKAKEFSAQFCFDEFWGFRPQTLWNDYCRSALVFSASSHLSVAPCVTLLQ